MHAKYTGGVKEADFEKDRVVGRKVGPPKDVHILFPRTLLLYMAKGALRWMMGLKFLIS